MRREFHSYLRTVVVIAGDWTPIPCNDSNSDVGFQQLLSNRWSAIAENPRRNSGFCCFVVDSLAVVNENHYKWVSFTTANVRIIKKRPLLYRLLLLFIRRSYTDYSSIKHARKSICLAGAVPFHGKLSHITCTLVFPEPSNSHKHLWLCETEKVMFCSHREAVPNSDARSNSASGEAAAGTCFL